MKKTHQNQKIQKKDETKKYLMEFFDDYYLKIRNSIGDSKLAFKKEYFEPMIDEYVNYEFKEEK